MQTTKINFKYNGINFYEFYSKLVETKCAVNQLNYIFIVITQIEINVNIVTRDIT